ncbi:unnamed protein product [Plutella xylostella]|uniref:(diamondback moth) hypothetical protein n=1 Tax=Plutella xylostella TaxID=51655 RepID=A0A8S4FSE7_PLUXY|nr:unnamed protein product [Plutella xylostella]
MEVDSVETWSNNSGDNGKFVNLKAFVTAAREFEASHSENSVNLMTRYLGLVASSCDLSVFSPGRAEVCAFFSSLWRVMGDPRGPHWAGLAALARAAVEPNARYALTHTYKFMPILARLLSNTISNEKKIKLLSVMQDISYGIKITWQESYLPGLLKQLTEWITQPMTDPHLRSIGHQSLTVLVNVCHGNVPAIHALMRTVDTKDFVVHLISLKDGGYGGVEVCRLLLCLSGARAGPRHGDVHSYLCCTMRTFKKAVVSRNFSQLLHAQTLMSELCADAALRPAVLAYPHYSTALGEALTDVEALCGARGDEPDVAADCLTHALKLLTHLVSLDLYSLRLHHCQLVRVCVLASGVALPEALELFAAVVTQYRDEGRLPQELISALSDGLPGILAPPALDPGKAGLQWLQVIGALCASSDTQEQVLVKVAPDSFEDTLYSVLQCAAHNGEIGLESSQQAVVVACRAVLTLAPLSQDWEQALARMLAHHQVRKLLCAGLCSNKPTRRRQILQLVKHHYFPSDQMNQVFGESVSPNESTHEAAPVSPDDAWSAAVSPAQEQAIDALIEKLNAQKDKITDVATSSVMELYGYKMTCLEQRLHSYTVALQGATENIASLQHAAALLQATGAAQQQVLYTTQLQNEKGFTSPSLNRHMATIDAQQKQLQDAETAVRGLRAKLAAERAERAAAQHALRLELTQQMQTFENEMKVREKENEEKLKQAQIDVQTLEKKLEKQATKNTELAGVLVKFEERVKQRDKRLEDAHNAEVAMKKEVEHKEMTIKQLEKTVLERENRLYQVTTQLEEMKRVQEMVAKLMSKSNNAPS